MFNSPSPRSDALRRLRAFAQVARLGSVSRAAEALGISQPAVTLQLQALADEHGVPLLQRSGRRLVPTEAGEALLALSRPLVDGIDGLAAALQARLLAQSPGTLSVGAGTVALRTLLPPVARQWTGGTLGVVHAGGAEALDLLREGSIEVAVGSWLDVPGDIAFQPLVASPARLLVPDSHPLAALERPGPSDLADQGLLLPAGRRTTRQLVDLAFGRAGLQRLRVREEADWPAVVALVALGQGITVSTALAATGSPAGIAACVLSDAFPPRPYGIALRRGRTPGTSARAFIAAVQAAAAAFDGGVPADA